MLKAALRHVQSRRERGPGTCLSSCFMSKTDTTRPIDHRTDVIPSLFASEVIHVVVANSQQSPYIDNSAPQSLQLARCLLSVSSTQQPTPCAVHAQPSRYTTSPPPLGSGGCVAAALVADIFVLSDVLSASPSARNLSLMIYDRVIVFTSRKGPVSGTRLPRPIGSSSSSKRRGSSMTSANMHHMK